MEVPIADRKARNRESAQTSRNEKRQRLGEGEYLRHAEAEKERRKKKKEQAEMAPTLW
jgi:hypothetical protein